MAQVWAGLTNGYAQPKLFGVGRSHANVYKGVRWPFGIARTVACGVRISPI